MVRARAGGSFQRHNNARMSLPADLFMARCRNIAVAPHTKAEPSTHRNASGATEADAAPRLRPYPMQLTTHCRP
jgi:hypothetical protein